MFFVCFSMRVLTARSCYVLLTCFGVLVLGLYLMNTLQSTHVRRIRLNSKFNWDESREYNHSTTHNQTISNIDAKISDEQGYNTENGFIIPTTHKSKQQLYRRYYKRTTPEEEINCNNVVAGDIDTIKDTTDRYKGHTRTRARNDSFENIANCVEFRKERGYIEHPLSQEELDFSIAFGILVYKDIEQVERLLRAIYRPQHFYCFHVDNKTNAEPIYRGLRKIASCFDNIVVPSDRVSVFWGEFSLLTAELVCMKHLWKAGRWRYFINLTGQEFPLKTNLEIVRILSVMDGANVVYGTKTR